MIEKGAVFPMFYLPPVEYIAGLHRHKANALIEGHEHLVKQTYRNRAMVCSPDGPLALTVPVIKGSKVHTHVKDVKISYDFKWQRLHWLGLQACYRRSAFFEYYEDDFAPFYQKQTEFLFDYNEQLLRLVLKLMKIKIELNFTHEYEAQYDGMADYRKTITPKNNNDIEQKPYFQVFEDRNGFLKNLSIVDLLFNQGPQSVNYL